MPRRSYTKAPTPEFLSLIREVANGRSVSIPMESKRAALSLRRELHAMRQYMREVRMEEAPWADSVEFSARLSDATTGMYILECRPHGSALSTALSNAGISLPKAGLGHLVDTVEGPSPSRSDSDDATAPAEDVLKDIGL